MKGPPSGSLPKQQRQLRPQRDRDSGTYEQPSLPMAHGEPHSLLFLRGQMGMGGERRERQWGNLEGTETRFDVVATFQVEEVRGHWKGGVGVLLGGCRWKMPRILQKSMTP